RRVPGRSGAGGGWTVGRQGRRGTPAVSEEARRRGVGPSGAAPGLRPAAALRADRDAGRDDRGRAQRRQRRRHPAGAPVTASVPADVSAAERLHPVLLHHIVNTLGWPRLRQLQEAAVAPLLAGQDALLLAPTAGGKTEAAVFPLLSRMAAEDWRGTSLLYLCPLKALLNNLLPRLERYGEWLGRRTALWHGDVTAPRRRKILT